MKLMITGSSGQLGKELVKQCNLIGHEVIGVTHDQLDICNRQQVDELFSVEQPDVIINCAAYNQVDKCEEEQAYRIAYQVNVVGVQNLACSAQRFGKSLVHLSTDYVFDGTKRNPLDETERTNPLNRYGYTKLMGERAALTHCERSYIVRTAWLYGDGGNFVKTMLRLARERDTLSVVDDQHGTPTSTVDLSKTILALIETNAFGLYHATNEGACTWYEFAREIFQRMGCHVEVRPVTSEEYASRAIRPKYSVLYNANLNRLGINLFRDWQDALAEYLQQI